MKFDTFNKYNNNNTFFVMFFLFVVYAFWRIGLQFIVPPLVHIVVFFMIIAHCRKDNFFLLFR
jgi:hypothetical protein